MKVYPNFGPLYLEQKIGLMSLMLRLTGCFVPRSTEYKNALGSDFA
jgi:hypothetical protein